MKIDAGISRLGFFFGISIDWIKSLSEEVVCFDEIEGFKKVFLNFNIRVKEIGNRIF